MKLEDKLFIIALIAILLGGLLVPIVRPRNYNYLENRSANQIPKLSIESLLDKTYQDNFELALADQIPLAGTMKLANKTISVLSRIYYPFYDDKDKISMGSNLYLKDDYLIYNTDNIDEFKNVLDNRIVNYNEKTQENPNVEFYLYYIEKDNDINFENNKKIGVYEYLISGLTENIKTAKFEINNISEFKEYYFKTDHHWNYKGSYKGYQQIVELLGLNNAMSPSKEACLNFNWSGSKARNIGGQLILKEPFCAYRYDFPEHEVYMNDEVLNEYGQYLEYFDNKLSEMNLYGNFYGMDTSLVEIDYHQEEKENLLIIGDSFDNAITELLASHFNKTYNIDLRYYEDEMGEKFNLNEFINDNKIDKVLLIGNITYFNSDTFLLT